MIPQVKHPSTAEPHDSLLVSFGRWSSGHSDRPRTSGPSDDGLKFGQFARIIQACGDLVACEIGKFRDNVFSWFATQNFGVARNVVFPADWHGLILAGSHSKGKAGKSDKKTRATTKPADR